MRWILGAVLSSVLVAAPAAAQVGQPPAIVTFASTSDEVAPAAGARLDAFAKAIRGKDASVVIIGHATLAEARAAIVADGGTAAEAEQSAASFAVGLSQRRANSVRNHLAAAGVPSGVMITQAFGAARPVDPSGKPSAADGRVEVSEGAGSGW